MTDLVETLLLDGNRIGVLQGHTLFFHTQLTAKLIILSAFLQWYCAVQRFLVEKNRYPYSVVHLYRLDKIYRYFLCLKVFLEASKAVGIKIVSTHIIVSSLEVRIETNTHCCSRKPLSIANGLIL